MWTDIGKPLFALAGAWTVKLTLVSDYMYNRRIFTADPDYFPVRRMREIVDYLHEHDQHYSTPCLSG